MLPAITIIGSTAHRECRDVGDRATFLRIGPRLIDYGRRAAAARGLYRVFNAAGYRFYRSSTGPPAETDTPFATSTTLPNTPAATFSDGTWYLSASYFNGVIDSGFLPLGSRGETYLVLEISAGALVPARPGCPLSSRLKQLAGGVVRIIAAYAAVADGANAADQWAIAYTIDGSAPPADTPDELAVMAAGPLALLTFDLPAQAPATVVKVRLQTRRLLPKVDPLDPDEWIYSGAGEVLTQVVTTAGPTGPLA